VSHQTLQFINKAIRNKDKYNILTFDTHERYQQQLCKTGHDFYSFRYENCKRWDESYAKIPDNHYLMPDNSITASIGFDFILSQSKFGQFQASQHINQRFKLPVISLEHTLPISSWPDDQLQAFRSMSGDVNVFISDYSKDKWNIAGVSKVIHHSVDSEVFKPVDGEKKPHVLSVVNDFINRDYCCNYTGWKRITDGLNVKLLGKTEGLSEPAESIEALSQAYAEAQVFLNTSTVSPIPTCLLEAMSCGCACVSTATCMIPDIIDHGVNGFISNDENELKGYVETLLKDEDLRSKLGAAARQTILDDFSEEKFINNWNETFDMAYGVIK
jgi:hypothetical protein